MPNWVKVELIIDRDASNFFEHSAADRQTVWELWRNLFDEHNSGKDIEERQVFNILRPCKVNDLNSDRSDLWGTKWDISLFDDIDFDSDTAYNSTSVTIRGDCAWCPPYNLVDYLRGLGFEVDCSHISLENEYWGTDSEDCNNLNDMWIDEDESDDDNANELYDKFGIGYIPRSQLYSLILGIENVTDLPEFILDEVELIADDILERYENWKDNFSDKIDDDKKRRHLALEMLEDGLEDGSLNEGDYLKLCNFLKRKSDQGLLDVVINECIENTGGVDAFMDYFKKK